MAVLLTDGDQRSTLAAVRALGRAEIPAYVGESTPRSLAGRSKYCAGQITYPSPTKHPCEFRQFLVEQAVTGRYRVLLPMTDVTVQLVAGMRDELNGKIIVPMPRWEQIRAAQDKRALLPLAADAGLETPATYTRNPGESPESLADRITYPVIVKPRFSKEFRDGQWFSGTVHYAADRERFLSAYRECERVTSDPVVQEKIVGSGIGVFLLVWDNKLMAAFSHRRLREKPPSGGVSVFCESIPPQQDLIERSFRLLQKLNWQGVAMVEFKVDQRDRQPKLMEINARFWGSLQLAIDAGVDFPVLLYRLAVGDAVTPQFDYRVGVRSRWLLGDLDHLLIRLRAPHGQPQNGASKFTAYKNFLAWNHRSRQEVFRMDDPAPAWHELKQYVSDIARHKKGAERAG
jgi:predicted ATP-grasp superfamily ATP-dependent carboligase